MRSAFVLVCASVFASTACARDQVFGPIAVYTETARIDRSSVRYLESIASEFGLADGMFAKSNRARLAKESSYMRQFKYVKGFTPVHGTAWFVQVSEGQPRLRKVSFMTVPNADAAKLIADGEAPRHHDQGFTGTTIEKRGGGWIVKTTAQTTSTAPAQPTKSMMDLHIARTDTVVITAWRDPTVHSLPLRGLVKTARQARGKSWYWHTNPTTVPADIRREFVTQLRKQTATQMQRRDTEPAPTYAVRRLLGETYLDSIFAALMEIERATAWISLPKGARGLQARSQIEFRKGGQLSSVANSIGRSTCSMNPDPTSILSIGARFGSHARIRDLLITSIAAETDLVSTPIGGLLLGAAERRDFETVLSLSLIHI